jgi:hypothetical protein
MKEKNNPCLKLANQKLKIFNCKQAITEAQTLMAKYNPNKICLSDNILENRRYEI